MSSLSALLIDTGQHKTMDFHPINHEQMNNPTLIASNLSILLKQHHLNTNQLAQGLGLPMMTIRRLLSGETEDPRISTLKTIADYFNISIDLLIGDDPRALLVASKKVKSYLIPKVTWELLPQLEDSEFLTSVEEWQSISLGNNDAISKKTFALESRPSMYPRFPKGTVFIIDPDTAPTDGDIVLIKIKDHNEFTLRELVIDPPDWRLSPLVTDSNTINFSLEKHAIIGVSVLTLLYNPKFNVP
jgi:transcriptional regulator with XRE-family HTH domain